MCLLSTARPGNCSVAAVDGNTEHIFGPLCFARSAFLWRNHSNSHSYIYMSVSARALGIVVMYCILYVCCVHIGMGHSFYARTHTHTPEAATSPALTRHTLNVFKTVDLCWYPMQRTTFGQHWIYLDFSWSWSWEKTKIKVIDRAYTTRLKIFKRATELNDNKYTAESIQIEKKTFFFHWNGTQTTQCYAETAIRTGNVCDLQLSYWLENGQQHESNERTKW